MQLITSDNFKKRDNMIYFKFLVFEIYNFILNII